MNQTCLGFFLCLILCSLLFYKSVITLSFSAQTMNKPVWASSCVSFFAAYSFAKASSHLASRLKLWINMFGLLLCLILCSLLFYKSVITLSFSAQTMNKHVWASSCVSFFAAYSFAKASSHLASRLKLWIKPVWASSCVSFFAAYSFAKASSHLASQLKLWINLLGLLQNQKKSIRSCSQGTSLLIGFV